MLLKFDHLIFGVVYGLWWFIFNVYQSSSATAGSTEKRFVLYIDH